MATNKEIEKLYDSKILSSIDINMLWGKKNELYFNHNGLLYDENWESYILEFRDESLNEFLYKLELEQVKKIASHLEEYNENHLLLDAGCGAGGSSIIIHELNRCKIEGYTLSNEQVKLGNKSAKKRKVENAVLFLKGNILELPVEEKKYNAILASENTEHIVDLDSMYSEFQRVLVNRGSLLIIAWCATDSEDGKRIKSQVDNHYLTDIHTKSEYIEKARNYGFQLVLEEDLTEETARYWKIRSSGKILSGSEPFMTEGFYKGFMEYHLLKFELR